MSNTARRRRRGPRAVVDTNLIISGLISSLGLPHLLIVAWRRGAFTLVITEQLLAEYVSVLARPQLSDKYGLAPGAVAALVRRLRRGALKVNPTRVIPVAVRDLKDEQVLAAALGGKAEYLVTGDDDLLSLDGQERLRALRIVPVREFLAILGEQV